MKVTQNLIILSAYIMKQKQAYQCVVDNYEQIQLICMAQEIYSNPITRNYRMFILSGLIIILI